MRATIKNYMDALKERREEEGEEGGFSLIELIIVVVILGILAAVAIPIFLNIQQQARDNAAATAAANAATQAAARMANDRTYLPVAGDFANLTADFNPALSLTPDAGTVAGNIDSICIVATGGGITTGATINAGPGC